MSVGTSICIHMEVRTNLHLATNIMPFTAFKTAKQLKQLKCAILTGEIWNLKQLKYGS